MTSLSIRLTVPLREVITRDALRQHTAVARVPREQHTYTPSQSALEASSSHQLVAKRTRLHLSASHTCENIRPSTCEHQHGMLTCMAKGWQAYGRRGSDASGVQREQRERRRVRW